MAERDIICVILAGGEGKRMGSSVQHKACFPIAGMPAIVRAVGTFKSVGVERFLVVIGAMAQQVISTTARAYPEVAFVYQPEPRGTGHAVACAVEHLRASRFDGQLLITMGDKVTQPHVVADLIARHAETGADVTLAVMSKLPATTGGRVVVDRRGEVLGIVELPDIRRAAETGRKVRVGSRRMTARQIERSSPKWNPSLYLFRAACLYEAVAALNDRNVQGELYLTDTIAHISARGGKVAALDVPRPDDLMAFNTPEELLAVQEAVSRRLQRRRRIAVAAARLSRGSYRPAREWLKIFHADPPRLRGQMRKLYGSDAELLSDRRGAFADVLKGFIRTFGPQRKVVLARAPGQVNLMGRHVDHRGGHVNVMAISREVIVAAAPRGDDTVTLRNLRRREFPDRSFRIGELLRAADWMDWMDYVNSRTVRQVVEAYRGDWSNYAKAAVTRLQHACFDYRLKGMDCMVAGNIPMGAGLSSSSAVVVAMAEVAVALNGLDLTPQQFVDLCGEGEWFVGARSGGADHAAIRRARRGRVARVRSFPFRIEQTVAFPEDLALVIANSHVQAARSTRARDIVNQRVATYNLAELLLKKRSAMLRSMQHLRDVDPEALGVSPAEVYRAVRRLPPRLNRRSAARMLPESREALEELFATHANVGPYRLRDVALFGIAECRRSDRFAAQLRQRKLENVGTLMRISHDGDRVVRHGRGFPAAHRPSYSDAVLDRLIRDAASEDPARRARAALWAQPGRYACSTEEIDLIVDVASGVPGVVGAQLAGAGLGGCAMILVRGEGLRPLMSALRKGYYRPRKLPFDVHVCRPVAGSGILKV